MKDVTEDFEVAGRVEAGQRDGEGLLSGVGEVGVDLEAVEVADDEQGRIFEGGAVLVELFAGLGEIFAFAFVFPAEEIFFPDIAQPSPPSRFSAPRSKLKLVPVGSASAGLG